MSSLILNPRKLRELPLNVQDMVNSLNLTQLSKLHAAICNGVYFDFLMLPLEIRIMIYRILFVIKPLFRAEGRVTLTHTRGTYVPAMSLLRVNKQISVECREVLGDLYDGKAKIRMSNPVSRPAEYLSERGLLRCFRKINLDIAIGSYDMRVTTSDFALCPMIDAMVKDLADGHAGMSQHKPIQLHLEFSALALNFEFKGPFKPNKHFDVDSQWDRYKFLKIQIAWHLERMRVLLAPRLPQATISSNIKLETGDMRLSEYEVHYTRFEENEKPRRRIVKQTLIRNAPQFVLKFDGVFRIDDLPPLFKETPFWGPLVRAERKPWKVPSRML